MVDGIVLCLRSGEVTRDDCRACLDQLLMADIKVLGAVLNAHQAHDHRYGRYHYRYQVYYGKGDRHTGSAA